MLPVQVYHISPEEAPRPSPFHGRNLSVSCQTLKNPESYPKAIRNFSIC